MLPIVRKHVASRNFDAAMRFVTRNYRGLLETASAINLVPAAGRSRDLLGRFRCHQSLRIVEIVNRRRSVAGFINTIVHELTHALHEYEGCLDGMPTTEAEREAREAGERAMWDYCWRIYGAPRRPLSDTSGVGSVGVLSFCRHTDHGSAATAA